MDGSIVSGDYMKFGECRSLMCSADAAGMPAWSSRWIRLVCLAASSPRARARRRRKCAPGWRPQMRELSTLAGMEVRYDHPVGPPLGEKSCERTTPAGSIQRSLMPGWSALSIKVNAPGVVAPSTPERQCLHHDGRPTPPNVQAPVRGTTCHAHGAPGVVRVWVRSSVGPLATPSGHPASFGHMGAAPVGTGYDSYSEEPVLCGTATWAGQM